MPIDTSIPTNDDLFPAAPLPSVDDGDSLPLATYAERAYLEYALSVVKGRALPDVADGQKPVQRRILYAMSRMGLGFTGANAASGAKPVKSARVVGDVLGRFHPHGDQAAYDALVRMAQDFSQRYPLIDGQGNFGSRDGDGAAAMRYTEARLAKITQLLLAEIDEGTVDFVPNYDGSTEEPRQLPARLPFVLLNGASGIAVGLACEIPSHNLREVADACIALIKNEKLADEDLFALLPGPDYPGGGQIISPASDIHDAYRSGRGSLKVRARWKIEDLARGQWQMVITELPPGVSTQKVLEEIEELTNPKVKAGKKALTAEQTQTKATLLAVLDEVRDESSKDAPVRIVLSPKSRSVGQDELAHTLLAHTSLETSAPINLTMVGIDGKPVQKSLRQMLVEWIAFRQSTVSRRSQHRLHKVLDRIHILEGRQLVLLNIDEVIAILVAQAAAQNLHGFFVAGLAFRDAGRALQNAGPVDDGVRRPFVGRDRETGQHARLQPAIARQRLECGEFARIAVGSRTPEPALDLAFDEAGQSGQHAVALGGRQLPGRVDLARFVRNGEQIGGERVAAARLAV